MRRLLANAVVLGLVAALAAAALAGCGSKKGGDDSAAGAKTGMSAKDKNPPMAGAAK